MTAIISGEVQGPNYHRQEVILTYAAVRLSATPCSLSIAEHSAFISLACPSSLPQGQPSEHCSLVDEDLLRLLLLDSTAIPWYSFSPSTLKTTKISRYKQKPMEVRLIYPESQSTHTIELGRKSLSVSVLNNNVDGKNLTGLFCLFS